MAQGYDKYELDNQTGQSFRFALNDILEAAVTQNSGPDSPNTTNTSYPYQVWVDTDALSGSGTVVKIRDAATASTWYSLYKTDANGQPTGAVATGSYSISTNDTTGTGGTTAITVDTSQRVGIGTATFDSASESLRLENSGGTTHLSVIATDTSAGLSIVNLGDSDDYNIGRIDYNHSNNSLNFRTNNNTQATITSAGDVGIGIASPTRSPLHLHQDTAVNTYLKLSNAGTGSTASDGTDLIVLTSGEFAINNRESAPISFLSGGSERGRFDSSGRFMVGTNTSVGGNALLQAHKASGTVNILVQSSSFSNNEVCSLQASADGRLAEVGLYKHSGISTAAGFVRLDESDGTLEFLWVDNSGNLRIANAVNFVGTTSGTVVGNQTSDERLKNVAGNVTYGLAEVLQLQPKQYALKSEPDTNKLGFIAQEVQSIIPEAVFDTNEELEGHQEGDSTKLGMEYVQLIPVLVNAIKEQQAMIETLQAKVAALESA